MCAISTATKEANQLFPLYLYPDATLTNSEKKVDSKEENFTADFRKYINKKYGKGIAPEQILGYIYAILHSETYRNKYSEFLKDKFARIPFTNDRALFEELSNLGSKLVNVHLLEEEFNTSFGEFKGKGSDIVDYIKYIEEMKTGKIFINNCQYFDHVPEEVWQFKIGGFTVVKKFLDERKTRKLLIKEMERVGAIINSIAFTIEQMKKTDKLTKSWI